MEITTDHERRARRAKAVALTTVLADAGTTPDDVAYLTPAAWRIAAQAATARGLLGAGRTVHPPYSDATVMTVQTELANLLALRAAQGAEADFDDFDDEDEIACDRGDRCRHTPQRCADCAHHHEGPCEIEDCTCAGPPTAEDICNRANSGNPNFPKACELDRRATDSQGYRATVRRLDPETAQAFVMFGQADRR